MKKADDVFSMRHEFVSQVQPSVQSECLICLLNRFLDFTSSVIFKCEESHNWVNMANLQKDYQHAW